MEKKINILGEELTIRFNMAVELAYEEIADQPFDVKDMNSQRNAVALYIAAIIANNPDTGITFDRFITEATSEDVMTIAEATVDCMQEWMKVPGIITFDKQQDEEEEKPKN